MPRALPALALLAARASARALPAAWAHGWDTVGHLTAAHGGNNSLLAPDEVAFVSQHYKWVTLADCYGADHGARTQEAATLETAAALKALDATTRVAFYFKSDMSSMLSSCSTANATWAAHPEWQLRTDAGAVVRAGTGGGIVFDSTVATFRAFWAAHLVALARALGADGRPLIDGFFIDGCQQRNDTVWKGVSPARTAAVVGNTTEMVRATQAALDALGHDQVLIWNAMDTPFQLDNHVAASGGSMNDHFGALGAINPHTGAWEPAVMQEAFDVIRDARNAGRLIMVKAWPGPLVHPKKWVNDSQPTTDAGLRAAVAAELDISLAAFLAVADVNTWFVYSWFWEMSDYIPFGPHHTCPDAFFPQYACPLGAPLGPATSAGGVFDRDFAHAHAHVDFNDRVKSGVTWKTPGCASLNRI